MAAQVLWCLNFSLKKAYINTHIAFLHMHTYANMPMHAQEMHATECTIMLMPACYLQNTFHSILISQLSYNRYFKTLLNAKNKGKNCLNGSTPELFGCAEKQPNKAVIRQKHKNKICTDRSKVRGSTKNNVLSITKYMFL